MSPGEVLRVLHQAADAVRQALDDLGDLDAWGPSGARPDQYNSDVVADRAALAVLGGAGLGVLSEETGLHPGGDLLVVLDPVDGSTNASRGLPWFASSLCALDAAGPWVAVVVNQATGTRFEAVRGGGARRDGRPITPSGCTSLGQALVGFSALPPRHLGWSQFRSLGAAALDLCAVASGGLDAFDCGPGRLGPWDYLGGMLVCQEAGAVVVEADGLDLVRRGHGDRRSPVAAATTALLDELLAARRGDAGPVEKIG